MKFETINGALCRMVEPEPIFGSTKAPFVIMGKNTKHPTIITQDMDVLLRIFLVAYSDEFEIIGYPVVDGSAEWAFYQHKQGLAISNPKHGLFRQTFRTDNNAWDCISVYPDGWIIEPKPLLADAKVGDLCKHRNGDWSQIIDTNGTHIPGQPIRTTLKDTIGINRNFCLSGSHFTMQFGGEYDIIHTEPLAPEGTAEWAWQMLKLGIKMWNPSEQSMETTALDKDKFVACHSRTGWQLYEEPAPFAVGDVVRHHSSPYDCGVGYIVEIDGNNACVFFVDDMDTDVVSMSELSRCNPSEVIVKIGCLEGTVRKDIYGKFKLVHASNYASLIWLSALDPETAALVRALLKAQEENNG